MRKGREMSAKRLSLILALLVAPASFAQENNEVRYEDTVSCEVRGVSTVRVEEGEHATYSGVAGEPNEGEQVRLSYVVERKRYRNRVSMSLDAKTGTEDGYETHFFSFVTEYSDQDLVNRESDTSIFLEESDRKVGASVASTVSASYLGAELRLTRYYKADWQGLYIRRGFLENYVYVATLRCQQSEDKLTNFGEQLVEVFAED